MNQNTLDDSLVNNITNALKNNTMQFHQFYNTDITAEENNLLKFYKNFKENTEMKRLNKTYYDIEVINNLNEFPDPDKFKFPVNSLATYNNIKNEAVVFCNISKDCNITDEEEIEKGILKKYDEICLENPIYIIDEMKIVMKAFKTESEMLEAFFEYLKECRTLILMGFNSSMFDDPYIINRTIKNFGEENANSIITDFGEIKKFGKKYSIIDYTFIDLLEKYKPIDAGGSGYGQSLPDYKLDRIGEVELGAKN